MSEFYQRFTEVVVRFGGVILEPPYQVPDDRVAYSFTVNGESLGVASFASMLDWAMAFDDLKDNRTDKTVRACFESSKIQ